MTHRSKCRLEGECFASLADLRFTLLQLSGHSCDVKPNEHGHTKCYCYKRGFTFTKLVRFAPGHQPSNIDGVPLAVVVTFGIPLVQDINEEKTVINRLSA